MTTASMIAYLEVVYGCTKCHGCKSNLRAVIDALKEQELAK